MEPIVMLKKDAEVTLRVSALMIDQLQQSLVGLMAEQSEESIEEFQTMIKNGSVDFDKPWMKAAFWVWTFIQKLTQAAIDQDMTYQVDDVETLHGL